MQLFRRFREFEEEPPCRYHLDGPAAGLDPLVLVPGHDGSGFQAQFGHRLTQGRGLPFPCLRLRQGLAHLDQHLGPAAHRYDEIDLPAGLGLVIVDFRVKTPERGEHEVLKETAGVDQNSGRHRSDQ